MTQAEANELFSIQVRLFRQFQLREQLTAKETEALFRLYDVFTYIKICYYEFHVQGDEANINEIYVYLKKKGWQR